MNMAYTLGAMSLNISLYTTAKAFYIGCFKQILTLAQHNLDLLLYILKNIILTNTNTLNENT